MVDNIKISKKQTKTPEAKLKQSACWLHLPKTSKQITRKLNCVILISSKQRAYPTHSGKSRLFKPMLIIKSFLYQGVINNTCVFVYVFLQLLVSCILTIMGKTSDRKS